MNKYVIALIAVGLFGAGWTAQGWRLNAEIAGLGKEKAEKTAQQATEALTDFKTTAASIKASAEDAATANAILANQLAGFRKDLKNAKPLPVGCVPDADRMRALTGAVEAVNKAAARPVPGK